MQSTNPTRCGMAFAVRSGRWLPARTRGRHASVTISTAHTRVPVPSTEKGDAVVAGGLDPCGSLHHRGPSCDSHPVPSATVIGSAFGITAFSERGGTPMATAPEPEASGGTTSDRLRETAPYRHMLLPRVLAGLPLVGIGLMHIFVPAAALRPMVEAAGFPFPDLVAPLGVAVQIVAGLSLLFGWWARVGALLGVLFTLGAAYAHVVIDVWPGEMPSGPPDALPVIVLVSAAYVLWRGAGRWSLDYKAMGSPQASGRA